MLNPISAAFEKAKQEKKKGQKRLEEKRENFGMIG